MNAFASRNGIRTSTPAALSVRGAAILLATLCTQAWAATVVLDYDPATPAIDEPLESYRPGDVVSVAVRASAFDSLHSYSVHLAFDTTLLRFERADCRADVQDTALLERRGGSLAAFLVLPSATGTVEIAAAQSGSDCAKSLGGAGVLAVATFKVRTAGQAHIRPLRPVLLNCRGSAISAVTEGRKP